MVRKALSASGKPTRSLDERLAVRLPRAAQALGKLVLRRPPRSRLRQAMLWRAVSRGLGAANRRDFEAVLPRYHPDVEIRMDPELLGLGDIQSIYRGHEGYLQAYRDWLPAWGEGFQFDPDELIDVGDGRLLALMHVRIRGERSGAELRRPVAFLWTLSEDARIVREQNYFDQSEALTAVGL